MLLGGGITLRPAASLSPELLTTSFTVYGYPCGKDEAGEVTDGWREIRWDIREADIGVSEKYGKIMDYVRFFARADAHKEGHVLDLYLDNMRLRTSRAPKEQE